MGPEQSDVHSTRYRRLGRLTFGLSSRAIVAGYRAATLASVLLVAALTDTLDGDARLLVLAPIAASSLMLSIPRGRRSILLLLAEVAAATVLVMVSSGPQSPFVAYFTVPLVDAALLLKPIARGVAIAAAITGLVTATAAAGGIGSFGMAIVSEGTLIVALPILLVLVSATPHVSVPSVDLTREDWELLASLETGATYAEIAEAIDVSVETAKVRISRLYRHLGARNRTEALRLGAKLRHSH